MRYFQYVHHRQENRGYLWQGRFLSCTRDEKHLYATMRYVENNPVRAHLVKRAEQYRWSSARAHVRGGSAASLSEDWYLVKEHGYWSALLREKDDAHLIKEVRQSTKTGRPCGDEGFLQKLEGMLGRKLAPLPRGRPRKPK